MSGFKQELIVNMTSVINVVDKVKWVYGANHTKMFVNTIHLAHEL
jgi:hypothetical protein